MQLHTIEPVSAPRIFTGALSPEVFTVSTLMSMPAVWTAVIERALPFDVLLERFLIVLLTIALLAELVRRLGDGGALAETRAMGDAMAAGTGMTATQVFDDELTDAYTGDPLAGDVFGTDFPGDFAGPLDDPLGGFGDGTDLDAPLALGDAGDDFGLGDLALDLDDPMGMSPLDLNADPFTDPA